MKKVFSIVGFFFFCVILFAQDNVVEDDSIERETVDTTSDGGSSDDYNGFEEQSMSPELSALVDSMEIVSGTALAERLADLVYEQAFEEDNIGIRDYALQVKLSTYHALAKYDRVIEYADSILVVENFQSSSMEMYSFFMYTKIVTYIEQGKYRLAIESAEEMYENSTTTSSNVNKSNEKDRFSASCNALMCIGLANSEMGMLEEAMANYNECISNIKSSKFVSQMLTQMLEAETYRMQTAQKLSDKRRALRVLDSYAESIEYFRKESVGTDFENAFIEDYILLMNICYADIYCDLNNPERARHHINEGEKIIDEYEDIADQYFAQMDDVRAKYFNLIGDYESALITADNAIEYYKENNKPNQESQSLKFKFEAINALNRHTEIYPIAKRIITLTDTLAAQRLKSSLDEMQTMMNVDKLENEARELESQRMIWILVSFSVLMAAFAGFVLMKRHRDKERQRILSQQKKLLEEEVERQTHELREQRDEIEQKNRDITDSINYAQRIQKSILPDMSYFSQQGIEGAFAFFIPCHIVSGDFYWAYKRDTKLYFACADCTGHGVPGAFMSMIGTTILNDLCKRQDEPSPSEILELLHINLLAVLQQSGEEDSRDGMDIAIMEYDTMSGKVIVSGARRPVYLYINGELIEYKSAKRSIGERDYTRDTLPFTQEEYQLSKGDSVYMTSDGLPDQFGGPTPRGKRLLSGGLKRMLATIVELPIDKQQAEIERLYWEWRNDKEQLDDISLVGIRV